MRNVTKAGRQGRDKPSKTGAKALALKRKLRVRLRIKFTPAGSPSSATVAKTVTLKRPEGEAEALVGSQSDYGAGFTLTAGSTVFAASSICRGSSPSGQR